MNFKLIIKKRNKEGWVWFISYWDCIYVSLIYDKDNDKN